MANTIQLHLLENKTIAATINNRPYALEGGYRIVAGEENATEFQIASVPAQYESAKFSVSLTNSKGYIVPSPEVKNGKFVLPIGMAVAGYGSMLFKATINNETVIWVPFKIKVWNNRLDWKDNSFIPDFIEVGKTVTLPAESEAYVTNRGTSGKAILDFGIPRGNTGLTGAAAGFGTPTIQANALAAGEPPTASVSARGSDTAKIFDFTLGIPKGDTGTAAGFGDPTIEVTGLPAGSTPTASITATGANTAKVFAFNFAIPQGAPGETGIQGENGQNGVTPHIGENGNWFLGEIDTDVKAQGETGATGAQGVQGGGFYGSTSTSTTSIPRSTVHTGGLIPLLGDTIVNAYGDLCTITARSDTEYTVEKYGSIRGAAGTATLTDLIGTSPIGDDFTGIYYDGSKFVPMVNTSLEATSWKKIGELSATGTPEKLFSVGDEKIVTLSTGEAITFQIWGFKHDDLTAGGKAGITFGMKDLLSTLYPMNSSNTNSGGWDKSEMRTETMQTLFALLPSDLQAVIKAVNKKTTAGSKSTNIITSSDKLWIPSSVEVDGTTSTGYKDEGTRYEYWKNHFGTSDRIKYCNGVARYWWKRTPYLNDGSYFQCIDSTGDGGGRTSNSNLGVCLCFCV